ncbi:unnamed protein product [Lupinus luteus]|uniref:Uncharacterized protein n=1 Tax=Lupinus luteus TaxID=3873 RepID=A0AAV1Y9W4_LUPLU
MEKITEDSITKKLLSPNHEPIIGSSEGSEEGIEEAFKRVQRETIFFMHEAVSDSIQEPTVENHNEALSHTAIITHKRKLSEGEGEVAIEKVHNKFSLPNDFTIHAKRIKVDLNVPIIDEDEGEEDIDEKVGILDSPHALGLKLAPQAESEGERFSLNNKNVESSAEKKVHDFDLNVPLADEDEDGAY